MFLAAVVAMAAACSAAAAAFGSAHSLCCFAAGKRSIPTDVLNNKNKLSMLFVLD